MSLFHLSDKLNHLSERRYSKGRSDIPKVLNNYYFYKMSFMVPFIRGKDYSINNYILRRLDTFSNLPPLEWVPQPMPGENIRNYRWSDPRVEFGMQNRRERRIR